ncbi:BREX-6 system BrxE protein [Bremerella sp.]|uniref:BREX-6 system BrxE protein n=1 Tax=Bremerella sp. TaxID=2795602 RepID=UPI00391CED9B
MSEQSSVSAVKSDSRVSERDIDVLLAAQLIVAWAGEKGDSDEPTSQRLGWWRTDLIGEGAEYDLKELLPNTWQWAMLQAVRYAAKIHDATVRDKDHDPDRLLTLYSLGFEIDEKADERLVQLKQSGVQLQDALPEVASSIGGDWSRDRFVEWVEKHGKEAVTTVPAGRRLKGKPPEKLSEIVNRLVAALAPLSESYAMPHFRRDGK